MARGCSPAQAHLGLAHPKGQVAVILAPQQPAHVATQRASPPLRPCAPAPHPTRPAAHCAAAATATATAAATATATVAAAAAAAFYAAAFCAAARLAALAAHAGELR